MGLITLKKDQRVALDSNIFIAAYNKESPHYTKSVNILEQILVTNSVVYISVLVFEEFLVKIYRKGLESNLSSYENFLTRNGKFIVVDFDKKVARKAAQIRAKYPNIKTPDAIHLASAIESGAKEFITADKRLPQKIEKLTIKVLA
jgi:predicted nucleic acid-binding protein